MIDLRGIKTLVFTVACAALTGGGAGAAPTSQVDVSDAQGGVGLVHASVDIAAAPAVVWRVMIDCTRMQRLVVNLKSCRIVDRDADGRWDVREQITKGGLLPGVRTMLRSDYDYPRSIRFHRVDGDFKVLDGEWRLEPTDGGAHTRVVYDSRVSAPFAAPGLIIRAVLRKDVPRTLSNLRDACQTDALAASRLAQTNGGRP